MKKTFFTKTLWAGALAVSCFSGAYAQGIITTVAGTGSAGSSGDGGPSSSASITRPVGVSLNSAGDIFIVYNNVCRKISATTGIISTVTMSSSVSAASGIWVGGTGNLFVTDHAHDIVEKINMTTGVISRACGNGSQGHTGDGGPATRGTLMVPSGSCVDRLGNIYIADQGSNMIRRVNPMGTLSTIAGNGTGTAGFSGDGGPATAARINRPSGISVDASGNIYFSDLGNQRIRKIAAGTGIISTVAGTGTSGFSGDGGSALAAKISNPAGLCNDRAGNIYIADAGNQRVRKIDVSTGIISTIAGNGLAGFSGDGGSSLSAKLSSPNGVWVDNYNNIYIADMYNNRIRKITGPSTTPKAAMSGTISENDVQVFPNPSTGSFSIQADASLINSTYEVYNMTGAKVYSSTITDLQNEMVLEQPSGIYFLIVNNGAAKITKRIVVSK